MARKPSDAIAQGRRLHGREAIWDAIGTLREFTRPEIHRETDVPIGTVTDYVNRLLLSGHVEEIEARKGVRCFRLARSSEEAPRLKQDGSESTQGSARDHMWRAMKMVPSFTPKQLAVFASTDDVEVSPNTALDYVKFLHKAGYLAQVSASSQKNGGKQAVYRLLRTANTGPKAPQVQRTKSVFDANRQQVVWPQSGPPPTEKAKSLRLSGGRA